VTIAVCSVMPIRLRLIQKITAEARRTQRVRFFHLPLRGRQMKRHGHILTIFFDRLPTYITGNKNYTRRVAVFSFQSSQLKGK
jgi:hypothetical protein